MLTANDLTFAWPGQPQPYTFSLEVAPAEIVAVSGVSGSGKSTLLDLIAGFEQPTAGSLTLDGTDLLPLPPEQRPVSILFQADNLFDHLSTDANLAFALPGISRAERDRRIAAVLEEVGLNGFGARKTVNLSGGQKQRVALARTLLRDKPVLLLDEPFSGLDAKTAQSTRSLVKRMAQQHKWHTILVSHDEDDITALADRRYSLENFSLTAT